MHYSIMDQIKKNLRRIILAIDLVSSNLSWVYLRVIFKKILLIKS